MTPIKGGRLRTAAVVALALIGSAVGLTPAQAASPLPSANQTSGQAAPIPPNAPPSTLPALPDGYGITAADQGAMDQAAVRARATGKPVIVSSMTDPTSQIVASPEGTFALDANTLPVRTLQHGTWVPVDTSLTRDSSGLLTPAATAYGSVQFSDGGTSPLAITRDNGATLSVSWPTALPVPVVTGSTATYRNALPGVDLVVAATVSGGFSDTLVIHTRQAAESKQVTALRLATKVTGGRLRAGAAGGLNLFDSSGQLVMDSPSAMEWDSNTALPSPKPGSHAAAVAGAAGKVGADPSDAGHPGLAARLAQVKLTVGKDALTLVPDAALTAAKSTVWPLYEDPTFNWHPDDPAAPSFDEVKQGCPGTSFYDSTAQVADQGYLGVGYNGWQEGQCYTGDEHAVYQWNLGTTLYGATINTATVNAVDYYSASCSQTATVNLHWSKGMGSGTDWSNRPGYNNYSTSASFGPAYNPGPTVTCSGSSSNGLNVQPVIQDLANQHASTFTATLSEDSMESSYNDLGFKRFTNNPALQIFFNRPPNNPTAETMSAVTGADDAACSTTAPGPYIGKTIASTPPTLKAKVVSPLGNQMQATFQYWVNGSTTMNTVTSSTNVASGTYATAGITSAFINSLTNGQTVDWDVKITDGQATTAYSASPTCHFTAEPTAPDDPTVTSVNNLYPNTDVTDAAVGAAAGTPGSFTIAGNGTTATKFVYNLDQPPATANPPANEVATATSNAATLNNITPLSPGPHTLWVYSVDAAGDDSGATGYPFLAAGHPTSNCASFTACLDNTAISPDSNMGEGDADGLSSMSATDLANAGWGSGANITVDGAHFTLPTFGSGQADNILAGNQIITYTGSGSALVFLANSTNSAFSMPGAIAGQTTAPYVPTGTPVSATYCFDGTNPVGVCPAKGIIDYTDGSTTPFTLTVPDWVTGPPTLAAVSLPHWNRPTGQLTAAAGQGLKIYPFAVPLAQGKTIEQVILPDVASGPAKNQGLHIYGMSVRNTTTSTVQPSGTSVATPTGQSWTGAWGNPNEGAYNYQGGNFSNQTIRIALKPSISGSTIRFKLDNSLGNTPLDIGAATVALDSGSPSSVPTGSFGTLKFGGSATTVIPAGAMAYSDPLPFTVTANQYLLVSYFLTNTVPYLVQHSYANGSYEWITATGSTNLTTSTSATPFTTATGSDSGNFTDLVTNVDVQSTGTPTEAVLGDNLIDPFQPDTTLPNSNGYRLSDAMSAAEPSTPLPYGVIAEGIEANQLMTDNPETYNGSTIGGPSALARVDRDILDQPGINTVVVDEGLEDLLAGASAINLESNGYTALVQQLSAWNINVVLTSLTPCEGFTGDGATPNDPCTTTATTGVDANRTDVNSFLGGTDLGSPWSSPPVYFADFDNSVAIDNNNTGNEDLASGANGGDHANLSLAGFGALANSLLPPQDTWQLNDGTGMTVATDTAATDTASNVLVPNAVPNPNTGNNPLTLTGGATWATDATHGTVLSLDGTTGYAASANTGVINTAGSYSVSAWAKLNSGFSTSGFYTVVGQRDATGVRCGFYLQYSASMNGWTFLAPSTDSASTPAYDHAGNATATAGQWYHLVGTYNAATGAMSLYVNGTLAGTGTDTTPWAANGPLLIGGADGGNTPGTVAAFPGQISNVQTYNYALAPNQVTALYQQLP